jgi:tetratricopeptide (TPR) repeat protein
MADGAFQGNHPSPAELDHFLLGDMSPRQAAPVLAHLMRGCARCQQRMAPLASAMFVAGEDTPEPATDAGAQYDFPLFKAFAAARRYAAEKAQAKAGAQRAASTLPLKEAPVENAAQRDWDRCQRLIEQCRTLRGSDPENMVLTARLAVTLSENLDPPVADETSLADLQARALGELGNARRVADDLPGAEADFARALKRAEEGTGDPLLLAQLMHLTASLYTDQRRFDEALQLLDMVYTIYKREGDDHAAGRTLISKGMTTGYATDAEEGVRLLGHGLRLIDPSRDPKLVVAGIHNLIWCLAECGHAELADQLFLHCRDLFAGYNDRLDAVKSTWLEGRIAAALGQVERADRKLSEARTSFQDAQMPYEVALVALDMAGLWLRTQRTAEIKHLIDHTITILRARKIRREAIGMLLVVREAFQKDRITEALLRHTYTEILRLQEPQARTGRVPA